METKIINKNEIPLKGLTPKTSERFKLILEKLPEIDGGKALMVECESEKEMERIKFFIRRHCRGFKTTRRTFKDKRLVFILMEQVEQK